MLKPLKIAFVFAVCLAAGIPQDATAQTSLRVMVFPGMQNLPLFAAQSKGFFAKRGLNIEVLLAPNSNELREGLATGKHQVAHAGSDNFVALAESGAASVIVMGGDHAANQLFVQPEIGSVAELKGKTVIVDAPNTAYALVLYKMLALNGLQRSEYEIKPTGATAGRVQQMLKDKSLAATILNPPFTLTAERGGLKNLGSAKQALGPYLATAGCVMRDWAKDNSDTLVRYIQAYVEGLRWALDAGNKDEVVALLSERMKLPADVAEDTYKLAADPALAYFARDAALDFEGFSNVLKLRAEIEGQWGGKPPPAEKYIDLSWYKRALETM